MTLDPLALAAVASPRRREILRIVWDGERTAGQIHAAMPDVTFGAVSLQLRSLVHAGLVTCRPARQFRYYRANRPALGPLAQSLERMWNDALWRLKLAAELEQSRRGPRPGRRPVRRSSHAESRTASHRRSTSRRKRRSR